MINDSLAMLHHEYLMHGPQKSVPKGFKIQFEPIMRYYLDNVQYYIKLTSWWVARITNPWKLTWFFQKPNFKSQLRKSKTHIRTALTYPKWQREMRIKIIWIPLYIGTRCIFPSWKMYFPWCYQCYSSNVVIHSSLLFVNTDGPWNEGEKLEA